ncbi:hypothetical protein LTR09_009075 [Extremus antarcticus]|uniref:Uncharacterized protein n=1 Tax=Extremus antarcticus TaxID=702011 RepID=A0AAJ0G5V8_9PEZI|nr:hypothetical protein LTR09_009075 [Extremus antarcticus]
MAHYAPDKDTFAKLNDSIVVITGGSTGIGRATVELLAKAEAKVVVGDVNKEAGEQLCKEYHGVSFQHCDVTRYDDIYNLFKATFENFRHLDLANSYPETGNWFDPGLTIESVGREPGDLKTLDVNVIGTLHFARIAAVFLREGHQKGQDKSFTILSSVNAFRESPGLYIYQTGKHAVHGTLRSTRKILWERDGIRVNAVCPGITDSAMTKHIIHKFKEGGLYWQPADAVGKIIVGISADPSVVGKAFYIEGGDAWEFEDTFLEYQPQWLGEESTRRMRVNTEAVQKASRL